MRGISGVSQLKKPDQITTIVLVLTGTGMAVARSASQLGRVVGIDADRTRPGLYSRHVQRVAGLTERQLDAELLEKLIEFAQKQPHPVVLIPAADDACEWLLDHREKLRPHLRFSLGYTPERAGVLLDKSTFAQRCRDLNIDVPLTFQPETMDDVRHFAAEVGLPCIVKPRAGHLWRNRLSGQKLLVPQTLAELEHAMEHIVGQPNAVVLQELVPGPERNLAVGAVLTNQQGQVQHVLTARKIRQFPRQFGSGSRVVTEDLPEVRKLSADVVQALDYVGICGTEFKLDPRTQRWRLIEINPRPTLWYDLCRAAGTDLIRAHVQELADLPVDLPHNQQQGVAWQYALRDVVALGQTGGVRAIVQALRTEKLAETDAVAALDDPQAALAAVAHFVGQAAAHLWPGKRKT